MLAVEHSADDAVPQLHTGRIFAAAASSDKTLRCLKGASHYFVGQPELLTEAAQTCVDWMQQRRLIS